MTSSSIRGNHQKKNRVLFGLLSILIFSLGISQIIIGEKAIALSSSNTHTQQTQQQPQQHDRSETTQSTDAIVYLAQFSKFHSTYGAQHDIENNTISGNSKLCKSLDLLYTNYIDHFPDNNIDIIIFYIPEEGIPIEEVSEALQLKHRPQLKLHPLNSTYWSLPHGLREEESFLWNRPMYSIGYRHMMRWFAILIWPYLTELGYTHVMRLDDDSYIYSEVKYDLFEYMRDHNKVYGFRQPVIEDAVGNGWDEVVDTFVSNHDNVTTPELIDAFHQDRRISFYNNFFIADISFFMRPPASTFLRDIDRSNLIYTQRTGDLVIHSTVVRLLVPSNQIHWFRDFSYQHMTLCTNPKCGQGVVKGCPQNGGLSRGIGTYIDDEWNAITGDVKQKIQHDNKIVRPGDKADRYCLWLIRAKTYIGAKDVMKCLKRSERCYPFLKQFLTDEEAAETSAYIPS